MDHTFSEHKEPDEIFLPLSSRRYAEFYSIEMGDFTGDIKFYQEHCEKGSSILELGCGTGRISKTLASTGHLTTGIDLSLEMLQQGKNPSTHTSSYICMDMTQMAFKVNFDHILIPYNTLNLLLEEDLIRRCLQQAHYYLNSGGILLLQLHIPDQEFIQTRGEKHFQFQMFSLTHCQGKLIKETLRNYDAETQTIHLEERYRVRPIDNSGPREDFSHSLNLAGFSVERWLNILKQCGFQNLSLFSDYNSRPFSIEDDSILLIKASRS